MSIGRFPERYPSVETMARSCNSSLTEGMRLLLDSVIKRPTARGGDPVIHLQTAFGGGKTHTMFLSIEV